MQSHAASHATDKKLLAMWGNSSEQTNSKSLLATPGQRPRVSPRVRLFGHASPRPRPTVHPYTPGLDGTGLNCAVMPGSGPAAARLLPLLSRCPRSPPPPCTARRSP